MVRYKEFDDGNFSLEGAPRSGRPSIAHNEENVNLVLDQIMLDPHVTYAQLEHETELSSGTINTILHKNAERSFLLGSCGDLDPSFFNFKF